MAGGGLAGVAAVVAAVRTGVSVCLIDKAFAMADSHRHQWFEDTVGIISEYLTVRRLEVAEILLHDTVLTVQEIAQHVGVTYERLRHLFQQKHGCSPGEFRKNRI